jgi:hypothetical protein
MRHHCPNKTSKISFSIRILPRVRESYCVRHWHGAVTSPWFSYWCQGSVKARSMSTCYITEVVLLLYADLWPQNFLDEVVKGTLRAVHDHFCLGLAGNKSQGFEIWWYHRCVLILLFEGASVGAGRIRSTKLVQPIDPSEAVPTAPLYCVPLVPIKIGKQARRRFLAGFNLLLWKTTPSSDLNCCHHPFLRYI